MPKRKTSNIEYVKDLPGQHGGSRLLFLTRMNFRSEGDADEKVVSSRCVNCGAYSHVVTSVNALKFCGRCSGVLRPLRLGEIGSSMRQLGKTQSQKPSQGCLLILVAFALIIIFGHK